MRRPAVLAFLLCCAGLGAGTAIGVRRYRVLRDAPPVVDEVDLARYTGRWYEIAKLPNRFQRRCLRDATAFYTLRGDGGLNVVNECVGARGRERVEGVARVADRVTNAKLRVRFGAQPVAGDYWIFALDAEYRHVLVGDPSRRYAWILARAPQMDEDDYDGVVARAAALGFDVTRFERTPQSGHPMQIVG